MAIRKLLLPLTGTAAGEAALSTCLMIARLWNAHVTALHVRVDSRDVAPLAGEGLSGAMIEEMMSATEKESSDRAHAVRSMFDRFVAQHEVILSEARPGVDAATASFASVTGREEDLVAQQARLADLTVVPHPDAGEDVSSSDALHAVLFDSGRPVLIAPQVAPQTIGARDMPGLERHGGISVRGLRRAAMAATCRCGAYPVRRWLPASRPRRTGPRRIPGAAWRARRHRHVPLGEQFRGRRPARGGARLRLRHVGDGGLFALPPAPAHPRRRHAACAGTWLAADHDEPLSRTVAAVT